MATSTSSIGSVGETGTAPRVPEVERRATRCTTSKPTVSAATADDRAGERPPGPAAPLPHELDARRRRCPPPFSHHTWESNHSAWCYRPRRRSPHDERAGEPVAHPTVTRGEPGAPQRDGHGRSAMPSTTHATARTSERSDDRAGLPSGRTTRIPSRALPGDGAGDPLHDDEQHEVEQHQHAEEHEERALVDEHHLAVQREAVPVCVGAATGSRPGAGWRRPTMVMVRNGMTASRSASTDQRDAPSGDDLGSGSCPSTGRRAASSGAVAPAGRGRRSAPRWRCRPRPRRRRTRRRRSTTSTTPSTTKNAASSPRRIRIVRSRSIADSVRGVRQLPTRTRTRRACSPLRPGPTSNSTCWPSSRRR